MMFGTKPCLGRSCGAAAFSLLALSVGGLCAQAQAAIVQTYDVGAGIVTSTVQIDFSNGNGYLFTVHHDGTLTGLGALDLFATEIPGFILETQTFPFGTLVAGMGVGADYEFGDGDLWPIENYWHYWVQDDSAQWVWSPQSAGERVLFEGSADAWVFGHGDIPQAVPGGPASVLLAGGLFTRRRRN